MIDLSYKVIPHFTSNFGTIIVLISEKMIGSLIYNFKISSDVTSIMIKDAEKFPYLMVNLNALVFDLS